MKPPADSPSWAPKSLIDDILLVLLEDDCAIQESIDRSSKHVSLSFTISSRRRPQKVYTVSRVAMIEKPKKAGRK